MEWLLGVKEFQVIKEEASDKLLQYYHTGQKESEGSQDPSVVNSRYDVEEADRQAELKGANDTARSRYQYMFWENVPEGEVRNWSCCHSGDRAGC